ncbi:hypothetical protein B0H16DRAFT_1018391 [Mycena metata]|uniref:Uncharacterized protein n=1 Tax=Mycena metata TaxID=1033252 RepID=A0AAD7IGT8_9AGAR|nr:hypothetical protein B0H16DRAFT_1018391 [Mycena metata]
MCTPTDCLLPTHHPSITVQYTCATCAGAALPTGRRITDCVCLFSYCASLLRPLLRLSTLFFISSALMYTRAHARTVTMDLDRPGRVYRTPCRCIGAHGCCAHLVLACGADRVSWQCRRVHPTPTPLLSTIPLTPCDNLVAVKFLHFIRSFAFHIFLPYATALPLMTSLPLDST